MKLKHARHLVLALASLLCAIQLHSSSPMPVDLGIAGNFTILAKTGISTVGTTSIVGNIGVSPASATFITGFGLIADASNRFSRSSLINGRAYASDYAPPTPNLMTTAISDMEIAYTDAGSRAAGVTELGAGNIGGLTLAPGVYSWGTGVTIPTDLFLTGNSGDVWILQIAQTLDISSATQVILSGGAQAKNIFWRVAGQVTLGTTSVFNGNILGQTAIVLNTGATLNGKALAQTAVTLDANPVSSAASGYVGSNPPVKGMAFAYPSPARGNVINVVYQMEEPGRAVIRIWNDNGDLVATQSDNRLGGTQKGQIFIRDFAPGVYLYRVVLSYESGVVERTDVRKFTVVK